MVNQAYFNHRFCISQGLRSAETIQGRNGVVGRFLESMVARTNSSSGRSACGMKEIDASTEHIEMRLPSWAGAEALHM